MLYEKIGKEVKCNICARRCQIPKDLLGFCRVRQNIKGKLYALNYGKAVSLQIDPIEKKPFFHFAPGSRNLSFSTVGCTFRCKFCCNWQIAIEWGRIAGQDLLPKQIIDIAQNQNVEGIAYTYVEPFIFFEYAYDTAKINKGYNVFVTDGYGTPEAVDKISKYLDAAVVDFKCSANPESYRKLSLVHDIEPIFDCLLQLKKNKIFIEISNLIIPKHGDSPKDIEKLCKWIYDNLGPDTPLHLIRFFPTYKMRSTPYTPVKTLEKAYDITRKQGLNYVYIGNVPGHKYESTYCPGCGELAILRKLGKTEILTDKSFKCKCGKKIPIKGKKYTPSYAFKQ